MTGRRAGVVCKKVPRSDRWSVKQMKEGAHLVLNRRFAHFFLWKEGVTRFPYTGVRIFLTPGPQSIDK